MLTPEAFLPSKDRGRLLNQEMQRDLLGSLRHLAEVGSEGLADALSGPLESLAAGQSWRPEAFGLYFELTEHLLGGRSEKALSVAHELAACPVRLTDAKWRVMGRGSTRAQLIDAVLDRRLGPEASEFCPIDASAVLAFDALLDNAMALLSIGAPGLHDEICAMVSDVLLAQAPAGARMEFDGASHYQFWGLLMLNPKHHRDRLAVAEVLAHESGHSVLFGLCREQVLSDNADEELYSSPLRVDPRPMDGIIHATYVSARMAWTMETLIASGCLSDGEVLVAEKAAVDDRRRFDAGWQTVSAHARLTPLGRDVLDGARAWMASAGQTHASA